MPDKLKKQGRQTTLWESDCGIVPLTLEDQSSETKPGNSGAGKAARLSRDSKPTSSTRSGESTVLDRLGRVTCRAKSHPHEAFNNVFTLLTVELLWYAFRRLKRGKSPGVDGVTMADYEENLRENLLDLQDRLHRGTYRPQPSVRKDIPKGNGKTRPLGIATFTGKRTPVQSAFGLRGNHPSVSSASNTAVRRAQMPDRFGGGVCDPERLAFRNFFGPQRLDFDPLQRSLPGRRRGANVLAARVSA